MCIILNSCNTLTHKIMRGVRQTYRDRNMIHEAGDCDDLTPLTNMLTCEFDLFSNEIIEIQIPTDGMKAPYCYRIFANCRFFPGFLWRHRADTSLTPATHTAAPYEIFPTTDTTKSQDLRK